MSTTEPPVSVSADGRTVHQEVQDSAEFDDLRRRFRSFIFPMTALFLIWYFLYVLLAAFAPAFMSIKVIGNINIGLLLGLGQFVSTFAITMAYRSWADKKFDPAAERLRHHIEEGTVR
ncbi:MAG: DUF485 domain-containing protein [Actinomycetes bacterium]